MSHFSDCVQMIFPSCTPLTGISTARQQSAISDGSADVATALVCVMLWTVWFVACRLSDTDHVVRVKGGLIGIRIQVQHSRAQLQALTDVCRGSRQSDATAQPSAAEPGLFGFPAHGPASHMHLPRPAAQHAPAHPQPLGSNPSALSSASAPSELQPAHGVSSSAPLSVPGRQPVRPWLPRGFDPLAGLVPSRPATPAFAASIFGGPENIDLAVMADLDDTGALDDLEGVLEDDLQPGLWPA